MNGKRIVSEDEKSEFVDNVLFFALNKKWTISNLNEALSEAIKYMEDNATLNELANSESPARAEN